MEAHQRTERPDVRRSILIDVLESAVDFALAKPTAPNADCASYSLLLHRFGLQ